MGVCAAIGNILNYIMSNSDFGRRHGAEDVTMFSAHGLPHVSNNVIFILMEFSYLGPQTISEADVCSFIIAMWVRNQNLGTPRTEGELGSPLPPTLDKGIPIQGTPIVVNGSPIKALLRIPLRGWSPLEDGASAPQN